MDSSMKLLARAVGPVSSNSNSTEKVVPQGGILEGLNPATYNPKDP